MKRLIPKRSALSSKCFGLLTIALSVVGCRSGASGLGLGGTDTDATAVCNTGAESCPCGLDAACDPGLVCLSDVCVNLRGTAECGNGNLDPGEECDLGVFNDDAGSCTADCKQARCGDGIVSKGEPCDDGNDLDTDSCTTDCRISSCGDGIVQTIEECDDGNADDTDACLGTCLRAVCGDGFIRTGEELCDDGNDVDGDGCESDCSPTIPTTCGNGTDDPGELCFDQEELLAGKKPTRPVLLDLDGDGKLDLTVANTDDDEVWIWRGTGSGAFEAPIEISVGVAPTAVALIKFDSDAHYDLITAESDADQVAIRFGTGTFGQFSAPIELPASGELVSIHPANLAGDATDDIVVSTYLPGTDETEVTVIRGTGSQMGPFPTTATNPGQIYDNGDAYAFAEGRVAGGNKDYLLAADTDHAFVRAFFVDTPTKIDQSRDANYPLPLAARPHGIATGDLNGDGADDVVTANWNETACNYASNPAICPFDTVSVVYGLSGGAAEVFAGKQDYAVGKAPWDPVLGDFDADGDLDIATANGYSGTVSVLDNDGGGTFVSARSYRFGPSAETVHVVAGNLNDDGRTDLVLVRRAMNTISILLSNP